MDNILEDALKAGGLEIDTINTSPENVLETEVGKKATEVKKELEKMTVTTNSLLFAFEDVEGEPISPREENGTYFIDMIDIDRIAYSGSKETQIRQGELNIFEIQQNIEKVDLVSPIHVVPFGRPINNVGEGLPKYAKYIILDGTRRYEAYRTLGRKSIIAVVNTTINKQLIEMYKGIIQNSKDFSFSEKIAYADRIKKEQRSMSVETLENFLGFKSGEFLKSLYIDQMKVDYPDIYNQVEKNKLTIEQGFKRLEKEIEKAEKALEETEDIEEEVNDLNDLGGLQMDTHTQELGNREILDANLRRAVESRDSGACQCCGFGSGEDDFMGGFNAHHIVPVMYQGADMKNNLILLCKNCHGFVHDYETGRFSPDKRTYDSHLWVRKVVVLGNMLRKLRRKSIADIAKADPNTNTLLQKGSLSLGKAIVKSNIVVGGLELFNNDPYQTFIDAISDLDTGGSANGEFGALESFQEEEEEVQKESPLEITSDPKREIVEEHKPRRLSTEELHALNKEEMALRDKNLGLVEKDTNNYTEEVHGTIPSNNLKSEVPKEYPKDYSEIEIFGNNHSRNEEDSLISNVDSTNLVEEYESKTSEIERIQKEIDSLKQGALTTESLADEEDLVDEEIEDVFSEDIDVLQLLKEDNDSSEIEAKEESSYSIPEDLARYLRE